MNKDEIQKQALELEALLRMQCFPLGFKLLRSETEIPNGATWAKNLPRFKTGEYVDGMASGR